MKRYLVGSLTVCAALCVGAGAASAGEFGLAITTMTYGPYSDPTDCPQGLTPGEGDLFVRSLPPKEREAWAARDERVGQNAHYLTQTLKERRTADGAFTCFAPTDVQDPPMKTGQSTKGYGLDLDGGDTTTHCTHKEFTGANGETGIDNQVARLTACIKGYQKNMDTFNRGANFNIQSGATVMLLRVSNVANAQNADNVTVDIYRSGDRLVNDGSGAALPDATVSADPNSPRFHTTTHGRIVNGELVTDPVDARIAVIGSAESVIPLLIRGARFRIKLGADGYGDGMLAGYHDLATYFDWWARQNPSTRNHDFSCPALYKAMHELADGYKDPTTGQCTAISTAINIKVVRTFVIPPEPGVSGDATSAGQ